MSQKGDILPLEQEEQIGEQLPSIDELKSEKTKVKILEFTFDGDKHSDLSLKQAVINNIVVGIIALAIYFPIEFYGHFEIMHDQYFFHVVLSLIAFVAIPIIYLTIFQWKTKKAKYFFVTTKKGLQPKKIISSLLQGIAMHAGLFYPWILLAQKYLKGVNSLHYFLINPMDWFYQIMFFALNVLMFEYYSKAFIQLQFTEAKGSLRLFGGAIEIKSGKWLGFILQNIAWLGGHIQEFFWLQDYIGVVNAVFFILVSGILTGLTVLESENIFGVSLGHVLLNIFVLVTYA
ncbi:MAG: hypothetical protein ACFFDW_15825 [Candidatus Thorarchaeota archaeon]